jgi:enamine deaminase RidA (YjgF/YER057c/UK114 family)
VSATTRLAELGIELPSPTRPAGLYRPAVRVGDLVFLSGAGPVRPDGTVVTGKVGADLDVAAAREAARLTGLQLLATLQTELGSLDDVRQVVKVLGMVNCAPGFNQTPKVVDGCSELLIEVFGEAGRAARSAVGMAELPFDIAVEIEAVVQCSSEPESQAQLRDRVRHELAGEDLVTELLAERRLAAEQEDEL